MTWTALWAVGMAPTYVDDAVWGRNRLFWYRAYDARNLADDFEPAKRDENIKAKIRVAVWGPRWPAFGVYDSHDPVLSLGGTDESGMCLECGGQRGRKRCPGHGPGDAEPRPKRARAHRAARPDGPQRSEDRPHVTHGTTEPASDAAVDLGALA